ncbi:hypothetical protein J8K87_18790 [Bacteroides fragilis]|uniref:hypothetical protein n=1 Tax=Bacteroides fragilis TaxID=817 RepID=UPI002030DB56|nr:hypothetical protein [Bacteroides fragilis]MCM0386230.1 hypothetical protein [Bacteroides fragilis]
MYMEAIDNIPALFRVQQKKTVRDVPNTRMVVIFSLVYNVKDIHLIDKQNASLRLPNLTLVDVWKID